MRHLSHDHSSSIMNQRFLIFLVGLVSFLSSIILAIEKINYSNHQKKRISGQILFFSFSGQNDV
jgi:hypothetical protein